MSLSFISPSVSGVQGFLFGGTGTGELALIFIVLLLLFGPRKLPEVARMIGRILNQLRSASNEFRDQVMRIDEEPEPADTPGSAVDIDSSDVNENEGEEVSQDDSRTQ